MGVGVASCVLAIGSRACHVVPGVGTVVVQGGGWAEDSVAAFTALRAGAGASAALGELTRLGRRDAQYAVLAPEGDPVNWTGPEAAQWSGDDAQPDASVQGNTLVDPEVVQAAHDAWAGGDGQPLEERLMQALAAGVAAGGDVRGQQSAALLTVDSAAGEPRGDLRVDDAVRPVDELGRLVRVLRAHQLLQRAWAAATAVTEAATVIVRARELAPEDGLVAQAAAALLMQDGQTELAESAWRVARRTLPSPTLRLDQWAATLTWLKPYALDRLRSTT